MSPKVAGAVIVELIEGPREYCLLGRQSATFGGMSYMRGANYIFRGEDDRVHLWIDDGLTPWEESIWAEGKVIDPRPAAGVAIKQEIMDEYVVMRFAELVEQGLAAGAIDRAVAKYDGNFGCRGLQRCAPALRSMLGAMPPPPTT